MKIAVFSTKPYDQEFLNKWNQLQDHELSYFETALNSKTVIMATWYDGICVFVNDVIDSEVLKQLSKTRVKAIFLRCAGFNNVDLPVAEKLGIKVYLVPEYSPNSVAEHATALILTLNRKTHLAYNRVRNNNFSLENLIGFDLHEKTVGVIGTGKIGAAFCKIMLGFGAKVIASDINPSDDLKDLGVEYIPLEKLFEKSDVISLHCPLTSVTKHIINKESLNLMKDECMLINTGRGGLLDTRDVVFAIKKGQLGSLGLDVYEQEKNLFFEDLSFKVIEDDLVTRLMTFPNVLITSHQGFFTKEAMDQIAMTTLENATCFEQKTSTPNEVQNSVSKLHVNT